MIREGLCCRGGYQSAYAVQGSGCRDHLVKNVKYEVLRQPYDNSVTRYYDGERDSFSSYNAIHPFELDVVYLI